MSWRRPKSGWQPVARRPVEWNDAPDHRWRSRPGVARLVRFAILAIPIIMSFLFALAATNAIAEPEGLAMRIVRWLGIAAASTVLLIVLQRVARRFIPLSGLLSLTLIFPDTAPSRFGTALRSSTPKQLAAQLADVGETGLGDTPSEAAEELLDLVAQLSRHDRLTRGHSERVRAYSRIIGEEMGLDEDELDGLNWAGMLHDVGKMCVPSEVLNKPGRLTDEEFEIIKSHTTHGKRLVAGLTDWLGDPARAVWEHHERWEGGGYPTGVTGDQLALASRIVSVADAFDVMTSARSYKKPISATLARAELERCAGGQFDPTVVRAMLSISLGTLWAMMGPLSLIAQIRLFPRRFTQASTQVAAAAAALLAVLMTGLVTGVPWADNTDPAAVAREAEAPPATTPSSTDPPATTAAPTTSTTTTTTTTTTAPLAVAPTPTTAPPTTARPTTAPTATAPTATAPPSTAPPSAQSATTQPVATTTTLAPASTTATTSTTVPAAPTQLTLASRGAGDSAATAELELVQRSPINGAPLPNYDTDRNDDPGITLERSIDGINSTAPAAVQTWRLPSATKQLNMPARLQLWFAPASTPGTGFMVLEAGLFDCAAAGGDCIEIARDTAVLQPAAGTFQGVSFVLTAAGPHELGSGRQAEIRVAVSGGAVDALAAYDSTEYPATITFGS